MLSSLVSLPASLGKQTVLPSLAEPSNSKQSSSYFQRPLKSRNWYFRFHLHFLPAILSRLRVSPTQLQAFNPRPLALSTLPSLQPIAICKHPFSIYTCHNTASFILSASRRGLNIAKTGYGEAAVNLLYSAVKLSIRSLSDFIRPRHCPSSARLTLGLCFHIWPSASCPLAPSWIPKTILAPFYPFKT
jgi:hypothetical protein